MTSTTVIKSNLGIILLDDDPIFRIGLITLLQSVQSSEIRVITQGKLAEGLSLLETNNADLLVISVDLATYPEKINNLLSLASNLESSYPNLPLLVLTPWGVNETIQQSNNIKGCCGRNIEVNELVEIIKICAGGKTYFAQTNLAPRSQIVGGWLYRQGQFGLREISKNIAEIEVILAQQLSATDLIYWSGRNRELKVARWLIKQILPSTPDVNNYNNYDNENSQSQQLNSSQSTQKITNNIIKSQLNNSAIISSSENLTTYDLTLTKIQSSVKNCTKLILEIDILQEDKKKELLILILNEFLAIVRELDSLQLTRSQIVERKEIIIKDLWQNSTLKFLSRYVQQDTDNYSLVDLIIKQASITLEESLNKTPFIISLLDYSVLKLDLEIDNQRYLYSSESAQEIEEILLQNLIINLANSITAFILNEFYTDGIIKHNLFDSEWKSSRKIAMFRNNLVWKYRREKYWENPKNIFEDEYLMLRLAYQGIVTCKITHPRNQELSEIKGLPWAVTILIEFRDSINRGVKSIGDIFGKTIIYLLTEIIGKGIGLIGKGILQGIGSKIKN